MFVASRRDVLVAGGVLGLAGLAGCSSGSGSGSGGRGTLVIGFNPEPPTLTSAGTTAGPTQAVSTKIFDGLVTFDAQGKPQPQLATRWEQAKDGLSLTFHLRPGVTWHDGKPFTSADVAYSLQEVWKKYHSRGRSTFLPVRQVETPDPQTVVLRLSTPAPYLISALGSPESQIVPAHLYAGKDFLSNPAGNAPIGTGPFKFVEWRRGEFIRLERNPDYWAPAGAGLDAIVFKIYSDAAATAAALETGEIHLSTSGQLSLDDVRRFSQKPGFAVIDQQSAFAATLATFEFNLDKPEFRDPRVRQAFAHAIDKDFLLRNAWSGYGKVEDSPVTSAVPDFYDSRSGHYPYDPGKAIALLDAAGLKPDARGVRLRIRHDPAPTGGQLLKSAEAIRDQLRRVGVEMTIRTGDFATFIKRIYTDRDFDTIQYLAGAGPDPAIGIQRFYWSHNIERGVAFSNGAHYDNPQADALLAKAQSENDPAARRADYVGFQQLVGRDLPRIPLICSAVQVVTSARVRNFPRTAYGLYDNFAGITLLPA
ncbi:ABC transporter substrate-binding protein [Novosphingobium terrae]|uniref:ABC transporter substrate-binding protein n=1 Tax=Novosphingobium terrae TaxID=2726189 RepID=UPI00197CDA3D|nr:ABC transporter substrate-binding protein [Novosphingobium terrae]